MRKTKTFTMTHGRIEVTGATKAEAKAKLAEAILWLSTQRASITQLHGHTIIIYPVADGWEHRMIYPDGRLGGWHLIPRIDAHEALQRACLSATENIWSQDEDDVVFLSRTERYLDDERRGELRRWIKFQREYRKAIQAGMTDGAAHAAACAEAREECLRIMREAREERESRNA